MTVEDPFAKQETAKAVSWSNELPVGEVLTMVCDDAARLVHQNKFGTPEKDYWDDAKTEPKMAAVVTGTVNGERRSIWATKPSALFRAIQDALARTEPISEGGTLQIKRLPDKPNEKNPAFKPSLQFAAKYEPPAPDAFGSDEEIPF